MNLINRSMDFINEVILMRAMNVVFGYLASCLLAILLGVLTREDALSNPYTGFVLGAYLSMVVGLAGIAWCVGCLVTPKHLAEHSSELSFYVASGALLGSLMGFYMTVGWHIIG